MTDPTAALDAQIDRLVELDYPALAGLDETAFRSVVEPLRGFVALLPDDDLPAGRAPFVLVVTRDLVRPEDTVPLLRLAGSAKPGRVDRNHAEATSRPTTRCPSSPCRAPRRTSSSTSTGARSSAACRPRPRCPSSAGADARP